MGSIGSRIRLTCAVVGLGAVLISATTLAGRVQVAVLAAPAVWFTGGTAEPGNAAAVTTVLLPRSDAEAPPHRELVGAPEPGREVAHASAPAQALLDPPAAPPPAAGADDDATASPPAPAAERERPAADGEGARTVASAPVAASEDPPAVSEVLASAAQHPEPQGGWAGTDAAIAVLADPIAGVGAAPATDAPRSATAVAASAEPVEGAATDAEEQPEAFGQLEEAAAPDEAEILGDAGLEAPPSQPVELADPSSAADPSPAVEEIEEQPTHLPEPAAPAVQAPVPEDGGQEEPGDDGLSGEPAPEEELPGASEPPVPDAPPVDADATPEAAPVPCSQDAADSPEQAAAAQR